MRACFIKIKLKLKEWRTGKFGDNCNNDVATMAAHPRTIKRSVNDVGREQSAVNVMGEKRVF